MNKRLGYVAGLQAPGGFVMCALCGAMVHPKCTEEHDSFHDALQNLQEVAFEARREAKR